MSSDVGQEMDTVIELVLMVLFLVFLATAMIRMVDVMSAATKSYHTMDKIEAVPDAQHQDDPFYLTGYQAYMMGWMMDTNANVTLSWLGTASQAGEIPTRSRTDGIHDNHATISTVDENGKVIPNFFALRNQIIAGGAAYRGSSVKDALRSVVNDTSTDLPALYQGTFERGDSLGNYGPLRFHLELTDEYTTNYEDVYSHGGTVFVERRKVFQWVLVPSIL